MTPPPPIDPQEQPSQGRGPYHRLQEAIDRIETHCLTLSAQGGPAESIAALRELAAYFTVHFRKLERLRSNTVQLTELWERP